MLAEKPRVEISGTPESDLIREYRPITSGLDYYKPTMSQLAFEKERAAEVTFTFKNRGGQRLTDYIEPKVLQARLDDIRSRGWDEDELAYLASIRSSNGQPVFKEGFLEYLDDNEMPPVQVSYDAGRDDIAINTTGDWPLVTFWETVIMSEVNEMYFENYLVAHNIDPTEVYEEGDNRLTQKINQLQQHPNIKIADFGTRRHFSYRWQKHVVERLAAECPDNFIGTSNVGLANALGVKPIGTFAHEMPMVYAGLADSRGEDIRSSHHQFLEDWYARYGKDYSIALTDTFGSDFFFADFTQDQAEQWRGVRHDSGDPYEFAEKVINFYQSHDIDPTTKAIVFSDGLDIDAIIELHRAFEGRIGTMFGWGTTLTNDLGIPALNVVAKATHVNGAENVKLSDDKGKHTGSDEQVKRYQDVFGS